MLYIHAYSTVLLFAVPSSLNTHPQPQLSGTAIAISGKILRHSVRDWKGGEQICVAHVIKDAVHARLMQPRPSWPMHADYLALTRK